MQEIALVDGLEHEEALAELGAEAQRAGGLPGGGREGGAGRSGDLVENAHSSASASPAASRVRSTWASAWASDGNQASNWDGGR